MSSLVPLSKRKFSGIRALHQKKERAASGLTLVEGERLVREALQEGQPISTVVADADFWAGHSDWIRRCASSGVATVVATSKQLGLMAVTEHSAGVLAVVPRPNWREEDLWRPKIGKFLGLMAVGLQDPGNVGALLRTTASAGGVGVWFGSGIELGSPKVIRASAGAVFRLPAVAGTDAAGVLARCRDARIQILAAVPREGRPYSACDLTKPSLIVLGGEGAGLDPNLMAMCDQVIHIPMPGGTESLNVAAAGAVILFEAVRQRRLMSATKRRTHE